MAHEAPALMARARKAWLITSRSGKPKDTLGAQVDVHAGNDIRVVVADDRGAPVTRRADDRVVAPQGRK